MWSSSIKPVVALFLFIFVLSLVFLPQVWAYLTVAFVMAYLLDPIVEWLDKKKVPREWGASLTLAVFILLVIGAGIVIIPKILAQGHELLRRLPVVYAKITSVFAPYSELYLGYNVFRDVDQIFGTLGDPTAIAKPLGTIVGGFFTTTFRFVTTVLGFLIIPLLAYYVMRDYNTFYGMFLSLVPKRHHKTLAELRTQLHTVFGGFVRGQMVVSSILATYYSIALSIVGVELSLVLGLMAGFFNIVPYLGILSVIILTFLIALIHAASTGKLIAIAVIFALGMGVEGSVLTPRIVGRKVGLSPLTLLISLLVGGELLGLLGMLLAVPLAGVGKVFLGVAVERYRKSEAFTRS